MINRACQSLQMLRSHIIPPGVSVISHYKHFFKTVSSDITTGRLPHLVVQYVTFKEQRQRQKESLAINREIKTV